MASRASGEVRHRQLRGQCVHPCLRYMLTMYWNFKKCSWCRTILCKLEVSLLDICALCVDTTDTRHSQLRSMLPNTVLGNLTAGATARSSVGLILMPMTVIKTRMESSIYKTSSGIPAAMRDIVATQGFRGLFAGFWPTTLRDAPTAGLFLVAYEQTRRLLSRPGSLPQTSIDASAGGRTDRS